MNRQDAVKEMDKAIMALYLQVPKEVVDSIKKVWENVRASQFPSQGLREEERSLLEKAHDITIEQLMEMQQERNKWKEMCLQIAEEMRRAEWVSPLYDKVHELVKNQTSPDGSQGLREAVMFAEWLNEKKYRKVASEKLLWGIGRENTNHTTEELYKIWKESIATEALKK